MMLAVRLRGIGLAGPGLVDWRAGAPALRDTASWQPAPTVVAAPERLPSAERRRAGAIVKLSLAVADQACAGIDAGGLATVFTSSSGDVHNCHALCEALAQRERFVSPTRFTNSVHNAAAGYWHIGAASRAPSTSLCGFDASFGAGLLEAAAQCVADRRPVLLVAADVPYPEPLHGKRPLADAFGVAFVLDPADVPQAQGEGARLVLADAVPTPCEPAALEALRRGVPAARSLPLLQALARGHRGRVVIEHLEGLAIVVDLA